MIEILRYHSDSIGAPEHPIGQQGLLEQNDMNER
jgi:hypothetical protein